MSIRPLDTPEGFLLPQVRRSVRDFRKDTEAWPTWRGCQLGGGGRQCQAGSTPPGSQGRKRGLTSRLYSAPWSTCSLPVLLYSWKWGSVSPLTLFCFFKTIFTIQDPLPFCMDFRISSSVSAKIKACMFSVCWICRSPWGILPLWY